MNSNVISPNWVGRPLKKLLFAVWHTCAQARMNNSNSPLSHQHTICQSSPPWLWCWFIAIWVALKFTLLVTNVSYLQINLHHNYRSPFVRPLWSIRCTPLSRIVVVVPRARSRTPLKPTRPLSKSAEEAGVNASQPACASIRVARWVLRSRFRIRRLTVDR